MTDTPRHPRTPPVIHLIGDSTMADKPLLDDNPKRGWGQLLPPCFRPLVHIINHARDGRSSKSFIWEGLWDRVRFQFNPGDWLVIQFGHNDRQLERPLLGTCPRTTYRSFLTRYVREASARSVHPVLVTPIYQRHFDRNGRIQDPLEAYADSMRTLARELDVPLVDLHARTHRLQEAPGQKQSRRLFLHPPPDRHPLFPDGRDDNPHLSLHGARQIARLFADAIRDAHLEFARWLCQRPRPVAREPPLRRLVG